MLILPSILIVIEQLKQDLGNANNHLYRHSNDENEGELLHDVQFELLPLRLQVGKSSEKGAQDPNQEDYIKADLWKDHHCFHCESQRLVLIHVETSPADRTGDEKQEAKQTNLGGVPVEYVHHDAVAQTDQQAEQP